jgi:hypothetical protein
VLRTCTAFFVALSSIEWAWRFREFPAVVRNHPSNTTAFAKQFPVNLLGAAHGGQALVGVHVPERLTAHRNKKHAPSRWCNVQELMRVRRWQALLA